MSAPSSLIVQSPVKMIPIPKAPAPIYSKARPSSPRTEQLAATLAQPSQPPRIQAKPPPPQAKPPPPQDRDGAPPPQQKISPSPKNPSGPISLKEEVVSPTKRRSPLKQVVMSPLKPVKAEPQEYVELDASSIMSDDGNLTGFLEKVEKPEPEQELVDRYYTPFGLSGDRLANLPAGVSVKTEKASPFKESVVRERVYVGGEEREGGPVSPPRANYTAQLSTPQQLASSDPNVLNPKILQFSSAPGAPSALQQIQGAKLQQFKGLEIVSPGQPRRSSVEGLEVLPVGLKRARADRSMERRNSVEEVGQFIPSGAAPAPRRGFSPAVVPPPQPLVQRGAIQSRGRGRGRGVPRGRGTVLPVRGPSGPMMRGARPIQPMVRGALNPALRGAMTGIRGALAPSLRGAPRGQANMRPQMVRPQRPQMAVTRAPMSIARPRGLPVRGGMQRGVPAVRGRPPNPTLQGPLQRKPLMNRLLASRAHTVVRVRGAAPAIGRPPMQAQTLRGRPPAPRGMSPQPRQPMMAPRTSPAAAFRSPPQQPQGYRPPHQPRFVQPSPQSPRFTSPRQPQQQQLALRGPSPLARGQPMMRAPLRGGSSAVRGRGHSPSPRGGPSPVAGRRPGGPQALAPGGREATRKVTVELSDRQLAALQSLGIM